MRIFQVMLIAVATVTLPLAAKADMTTGTGSMIKKDAYGTENLWGRVLTVPRDGTVVRVMYGTYGFSIRDAEGRTVGDFLLPEMAVGTRLAAGEYRVVPYVCEKHRHHHVEVTVAY
ncbi:hypothetical protein [uncultured Parvibaculum sp.]|uniref:hypothetical protein n=1 Tax=uncultured Parvibaculum sp. TaxID=291828 RepID=UPI0030D7265D|tara:strand:+ start:61466 stop:61813 length:348 start_codon:yes stop_codon:yes gene_type:complete